MKDTLHGRAILAGLAVAAFLGAGCATPFEVAFDEREDLSPNHTWSWARDDGPRVVAPEGEAAALEAGVRRYIEESLAAKGFQRTRRGADFVVRYRLALARRYVVEHQARAPYLLSSHSSSPSFVVEGTEPVTREYQALHLAISAGPARGKAAWRAELRQSGEENFSLTLQEAVTELLGRFPTQKQAAPCNDSSQSAVESESDRRCAPSSPRAPQPSPHRLPAARLG